MIESQISKEEQLKRFLEELEKLIPAYYRSINAVGNAMNIPPNNLHNVRTGKLALPEVYIYKLCDLMKWEPAYFFGRAEKLQHYGLKHREEELKAIKAELEKIRDAQQSMTQSFTNITEKLVGG